MLSMIYESSKEVRVWWRITQNVQVYSGKVTPNSRSSVAQQLNLSTIKMIESVTWPPRFDFRLYYLVAMVIETFCLVFLSFEWRKPKHTVTRTKCVHICENIRWSCKYSLNNFINIYYYPNCIAKTAWSCEFCSKLLFI